MITSPLHMASGVRRTITSMLSDERVRSGLLWNLVATIAGRSSGLVVSVIVARMLGKEGFGEFGIIQSTIVTFGVFAGFGAGLTATKHIAETFRSDALRAGRVMTLSVLLACLFGAVISILLFLAAPLIASRALASPGLAPVLRIASIGLAASALTGTLNGALAGFEEFQSLSRVTIYSGVLTILCMTAGVYWGGLGGALWGYNIAMVLTCLLGLRALREAASARSVTFDFRTCFAEWTVLWQFSLPTMLSNTLVMPASWVCNAMLVNRPDGYSEMAVYSVASQWRQLLLFLPGIAAQVFLPILASQQEGEGKDASRKLYLRMNLLITLPFLALTAVVSPLIMALYGQGFAGHWPVFVIVQVATFMQIVQAPTVTSWAAEGRMWTNFLANGFWGACLVIGSWLLIGMGALGLGLALTVSFLIYFAIIRAVESRVEVTVGA